MTLKQEEIKTLIKGCKFVIQKNQKGTADAIEKARNYIKTENFIVLFGDVPLVNSNSLKKLSRNFKNNKIASMILFNSSNPKGYGRVILNNKKVEKVVEEINTSNSEKLINLCNSGIMMVNKILFLLSASIIFQ